MFKRCILIGILGVFGTTWLCADFSYEQTSKLTGGTMATMMRAVGVFSKQAREPMSSRIMVKGDRMVTLSRDNAHVIDLNKETITEINFEKKTYSVITFAQMAQALQEAEKKLQEAKAKAAAEGKQAEMDFKASVNETGQSKQINGLNTKEVILTLEMEMTDRQSGQKGAMVVTGDMWLAQGVPGYEEIRDFYLRMMQKLPWTPGSGGFAMMQPGVGKGMANLMKEASKLDGVPVHQVMRMGLKGEGGQMAGAGQPAEQQQPAPQMPSAGQAAGDAAGRTAAGAAGGRLGRLGGLAGGLGGLGRRGKKQEEAPPPPPPPAATDQQTPPAGGISAAPGSLMEMTTELSGFSSAPVDPSKFEVPAGFKQVESEMMKAMRR
jgi:hypothetical protein